jgi:hypothetical protein
MRSKPGPLLGYPDVLLTLLTRYRALEPVPGDRERDRRKDPEILDTSDNRAHS